MPFSSFLWLLVWGGMFTGDYNIRISSMLSSPMGLFQGLRALFPFLAVYIVFIWICTRRPRFPFVRSPLRFFFLYWMIGCTVSLLFSPSATKSLYWAVMYLSPFLVMWIAFKDNEPQKALRIIIYLNYGIFIALTISLVPAVLRGGDISIAHDIMYDLPFNLGQVISNGVGRYGLIALIVSTTRFLFQEGRKRYLWLLIIIPSLYVLARTQSRTALLGLAVASVLFVLMRRIDWRLIFAGPIAAYVLWVSGYQWRAGGSFDRLVDLSGRENAWQIAIALIKGSPFFGWGFHADRYLLGSEHMHNSFLHAMVQSGIIGAFFFVGGFVAVWLLIIKSQIIGRAKNIQGKDKLMIMEAVMLIGFLTSRSFFESTAAYYGVDLLLLVPLIGFVYLWSESDALKT